MGGGYASEHENLSTAKRCAAAILAYWRAKGIEIEAWVEPVSYQKHSRTESLYVVKTKGIPGVK